MRIAALPQVLFDEFPSDDSIKICILTRPHYPIPDLSGYVGKLLLYCTKTAIRFIGSFPKKMPFSLFRLLPEDEPNKKNWERIDESTVKGLETRFAITCIPTGSVIDSVFLLIFTIDDPDHLSLYTGMFKQGRQLLLSNTVWKYKSRINDIYFDNTMASSYHKDITNKQASEDIKKVIDDYPGFEIHLQMEAFESLDLVIELAIQHRLNVKLSEIQQIFLHKSTYRKWFEFDAQLLKQLGNTTHPNNKFKLRNRPKIHIKTIKTFDLTTYKRLFHEHKIINIKLIGSGNEHLQNSKQDGLIYISYSSHAGAYTLSNIFETIKPIRVHPIVRDDNMKIPENILNEGCQITDAFIDDSTYHEVTMDDISSARRKNRSFLAPSTTATGTLSKALSRRNQDDAKGESLTSSSIDHQSNDTSSVCIVETREHVIIIDSDSDSDKSLASDPRKKKRPSSSLEASSQHRPKIRKLNQEDNKGNTVAIRDFSQHKSKF